MTLVSFPLNGVSGATVSAGANGISTISTTGGTLTYQSSAAFEGTAGVRADATSAGTVFCRFLFSGAATNNTASMSVRWKVPTALPSAQTVFAAFIDTAGALVGQLVYGTTGAVFFSDKSSTQTQILSAAQATAGSSFRFFMTNTVATTTTGLVTARAYSTGSTQVGSTVSLSNANLGTTAMKGAHFGVVSAVIMRSEFDDPQLNDGSTTDPGEYTANTTPPTIVAGANQTIASTGSPVSITCTATAQGTSAGINTSGYVWTAISWPLGSSAPTITNPSSQTASFTPSVTGRYIFGVTASDLEGNVSAQATTRVFLPDVQLQAIEVTSNSGWTVAIADLNDSSDATYADSGAPGANNTLVLRLKPLISNGTALSLDLRELVTAVAGTQKVALLEGASVRKDWGTISPTTSAADLILSMNSTEMATVGSWNELDLRLIQV